MLLQHEEFLTQLESLLSQTKGSVFLTLKRYAFEGDSAGDTDMSGPSSSTTADSTYPYLARVTNGHKFKISTKVQPSEYEAFTSRFTALLKSSMTPKMKKKDKKKQHQQAGAPGGNKLGATRLPKIKGPPRGNGHSKRQRSVKARAKVLERLQLKKRLQDRMQARLEVLRRNIEAAAAAQ